MHSANAQLDQLAAQLARLNEQAPEALRRDFELMVEASWIHHESALEGVVYSSDELLAALRGETPVDANLVSTFDEIRQNRAAIHFVRRLAAEGNTEIDLDVLRDLYFVLAPDEADGKKVPNYRKDIPLHRLYFHEITPPDKILPKLKAFVQWVNDPEVRRSTHALRLAAKAHFHLLHIYPFPKHSGKVARLVMNLLLLEAGYPPAVIHSTDRQRYYDALKTNENALAFLVKEALSDSVESAVRFLEPRVASLAPPPAPRAPKPPPRKRAEPTAAKTTEVLPQRPTRTTVGLPKPSRNPEPPAEEAEAKRPRPNKAPAPAAKPAKPAKRPTKPSKATKPGAKKKPHRAA